jgi:O-antigen/teichoic acid export membrane protein
MPPETGMNPASAPAPPSPDAPGPLPPSPSPAAPLTRAAGRGMSWMLVATVVCKAVTFVAQVVLGWLLTKGDFGVYAIAISLASLMGVVRDAGLPEWLIARGPRGSAELEGPSFWLALTFNTAIAGLIALASPLAARLYDDPRIMPLLLVAGLSMPLATPAAILRVRARVELRFGLLSRIQIGTSLIRSGGAVALAFLGMGPMSFVLPLLASAMYENIHLYAATRDKVWQKSPGTRRWGWMIGQTRWLILGLLANLLLDRGDYLTIGIVLTKPAVGVYFFGFELVGQLATLLSFNLQQVLLPILAKLKDEPARLRGAVDRSLRAVMLVASPACLGLAVVAEPLEHLLWRGKFAQAVPVIQIFGVFFPLRITFGLTMALLQARSHFKTWFWLTLIEGLGVMAAAWMGATFGGTPADVALWVGAELALFRMILTAYTLEQAGVGAGQRLRAIVPGWLLAIAAAGACVTVDWWLVTRPQWWGPAGVVKSWTQATIHLKPGWATRADDALRIASLGMVFTALYTAGARLLMPDQFRDALRAVPPRIGRRLERAFFGTPTTDQA